MMVLVVRNATISTHLLTVLIIRDIYSYEKLTDSPEAAQTCHIGR